METIKNRTIHDANRYTDGISKTIIDNNKVHEKDRIFFGNRLNKNNYNILNLNELIFYD